MGALYWYSGLNIIVMCGIISDVINWLIFFLLSIVINVSI